MVLAVLIICLVLVLLLTIFAASLLVAFFITKVPLVRTEAEEVKFVISKLNLTSRDVIYELGSGDGVVVFLFEKLIGCQAVGYELSWFNVILAKLKTKLIGSKAKFINRNFFKQDWSDASIIYCYLFPPLMGRVEQKFKNEMRPGSLAIVRDFPFPTMEYWEKYTLPKGHRFYIYKV